MTKLNQLTLSLFITVIDELDKSDILVAVLDGIAIDPGVAAEIGYFAAHGKNDSWLND